MTTLWLLLPEARAYFAEVCPSLSQRFPLCVPPAGKQYNHSFNCEYRTSFYPGQESGHFFSKSYGIVATEVRCTRSTSLQY